MNDEREFSLDEICQHSKELFGVYPEVIYRSEERRVGKEC